MCSIHQIPRSDNQQLSDHVTYITHKTNNVRALLQRNLKHCLPSVKTECYESYIRPIQEYCSTVWAPHTLQDTLLEGS